MKKLILILALLPIPVFAQCVAVENAPQYGIQTLPGSVRQINVKETGCPGGAITSLSATGTTISGVGTGFSLTVGKSIIITISGFAYPFDTILGMPLVLTAATSTTFSATLPRPITSSSVSLTGNVVEASLINWSEATTTGSVTAALDCASNCAASVKLTMDGTNGNCTITGTGPYVLTSTQIVTVTATPVDNPSGAASFPIYQCANTTTVYVGGAGYSQAYQGQRIHIPSAIIGNSNQAVTWAITSTPSGGNGSLDGAVCQGSTPNSCRETYFNAGTVQGRYTITATSVADGTKSDYRIVYVASTGLPSYHSAPPDYAEPYPCEVDPALTGTDYEVGPGQAYTTINAALATPFAGGGNIVRIHPGTYNEYIQIGAIGTSAQPNIICGIPDSSGNLPIMDGSGAHGPTYYDVYLYGAGLINTFPTSGGCSVNYPNHCGPAHVWVSGLRLQHATAGYTYYEADGVTTGNWGEGSDGADVRTGIYVGLAGMRYTLDSQGVGTYNNGNNQGYGALTYNVEIDRSFFDTDCLNGSDHSHSIYSQSIAMFIYGNLLGPPVSGSGCSSIKIRGINNTVDYNTSEAGYAREHDWVETQDAINYVDMASYINNDWSGGDTFGANNVVALQESIFNSDAEFSNIVNDPSFTGNSIHYAWDNDDNNGNAYVGSRYGRLNSFYNTYYLCGQIYDTGQGSTDNYYYTANFYLANNIWYCPGAALNFNAFTQFIAQFQNNLMRTGLFDNSLPITGGTIQYGTYLGWGNNYQSGQPLFALPINNWLTGNLTTDFVTTSSVPFDTTTFIPSGPAVGTANGLTGTASLFQVSSNAVNANGVVTSRTNANDIGAVQGSSTPPAAPTQLSGHIAITPNVLVQ